MAKLIKIKLIKSSIGRKPKHKEIVRLLGLGKLNSEVTHNDIPAIRGIEFGTGFAAAKMFGVNHNDSILDASGKTSTNHAGGIVGGITNGNDMYFKIAIKPTASTPKEQQSWNWERNIVEPFSVKGRHDLCIALRVPVVLEAVTSMVLVDLMLRAQQIPLIIKD